MNVLDGRKIKQKAQCGEEGDWFDVSCQGIPNDCCIAQDSQNEVYECTLAGSNGQIAWYTREEINDPENLICSKEDQLTSDWLQIKFSTGICMNAFNSSWSQFAECSAQQSQWFRFVGDGQFKQFENGQYVGRCLSWQVNDTQAASGILFPKFDLVPCSESTTEWNWSDDFGLSIHTIETQSVFPKTKDVMVPELYQLRLTADGNIMATSVWPGLPQSINDQNTPVQRNSPDGQQNPQLKDGTTFPQTGAIAPTTVEAEIILPNIQSTGNWSDEILEIRSIITETLNNTNNASHFINLLPTYPVSSITELLNGPFYCDKQLDGIQISCDHMQRIVAIQFDPVVLRPVYGELSASIFNLPKLRNLVAKGLDLTGVLPSAVNPTTGKQEDAGDQFVIRELALADNSFDGPTPSDWQYLESLINVDLSGNSGSLQIGSAWKAQRVFGILTTIDLDTQLCTDSDFSCENQELVDRFPCLETICSVTEDPPPKGKSNTSIGAIIGSVVAALVVFAVILVILFLFVMRKRQGSDLGMEMSTGLKYDSDKVLGKSYFSGRLTPPKREDTSGQLAVAKSDQPPMLEHYLQDECVVTWNTPPQYIVNWEIDYDRDLKPKATLGVGAMGTVQLAEWTNRSNGEKQLVAVKVFSRNLQPIYKDAVEVLNQKLILREVEILMRVQHPNIVKCLGAILKPPNMGLVLEYMDVGNLDKYLHNICCAYPINDRDKLVIMKQIARALDHLHPSVVHRDLKPQNILINQQGEIKLSDFGLSKIRQLQDAGRASSLQVLGTAPYTSPEVFRSNGMNVEDEKVDIYSLGVIMWEIWTLQRPWDGENMVAISYKVVNEGRRPPMPDNVPTHLQNLIQACWYDDPQRRPSARDIQRKLEWIIKEIEFNQVKYNEMQEQQGSGCLDEEPDGAVIKEDSTDHISVPADENHESIQITFIFPDGSTFDCKFGWRDSLLLLTDEVNDMLGHQPDGDISHFRLYRITETPGQDPQVLEVNLNSISDTLQQHGFYTRNKVYVEVLQQTE
eukprot:TRINITY_DN8122_c0_g1_i1.p1 TRINITY_DN8122_c0_g1~~TRINITY_DN8122_c0_g1_i1.p1  ORF type:complete len:1022 (+),score=130.66 TRINITY_DN8122_c0_g1_i1:70-3135(+)